MADIFYPPHDLFDLAGNLENESISLKTGIDLINETLMFNPTHAESASKAQDHLYFLVAALASLQKRIAEISIDAQALAAAVKVAE